MKYNVAVIGGGPAGMMAAIKAAQTGAGVILIEKNPVLGKKLLASGGGRCNLTNNLWDIEELVTKFENGKFLYSAFYNFSNHNLIEFFESRGVKTKVEDNGRVFPESNKSRDILDLLVDNLKQNKVTIKTSAEVETIVVAQNRIEKVTLIEDTDVMADNFIICTGGLSCPVLGSTGDGYKWLKQLGHKITRLMPAIVPLSLDEDYIKSLEGLGLKDVELNVVNGNKKIISQSGDAIFTASGLSGPVILNISSRINHELPADLILQIDFCPELSTEQLNEKLLLEFEQSSKKLLKNILFLFLPQRFVPVMLKLAGIDVDKNANSVTREERQKIICFLKEFKMKIKGTLGFERSMVTSGGVKLADINPKTLKSKKIDNLFVAGEILDLTGPTGGYNLQMCWSTGYLAGENAARQN